MIECKGGSIPMSARKFDFSLQRFPHGWWAATLSDGLQEATITASSIPSEPLLPLLWAVRLLLLGTSEARFVVGRAGRVSVALFTTGWECLDPHSLVQGCCQLVG